MKAAIENRPGNTYLQEPNNQEDQEDYRQNRKLQ